MRPRVLPVTRLLQIISEDECRASITMADAVPLVEDAFAALAGGLWDLGGVINLDIPEAQGEIHVKAAHRKEAPFAIVKVASGFWGNSQRDLPVGSGLMLALDASTGVPLALIEDNGFLTELRTGAAGGVVARHLAKQTLDKVAVVGSGVQARFQLRGLAAVRHLSEIWVWGPSAERRQACCNEIQAELDVRTVPIGDVEAAVREADLVITVTPSRKAVIEGGWLSRGAHLTAIGADGPEKRELDADVFRMADVVVADLADQCARIGEIHHAIRELALDPARVVELGDIVVGKRSGRSTDADITVADLTGVAIQDAAVASFVLDRNLPV